ncbi:MULTISPECIES: SAV_915 family protein [unclassified Aeromicrobium]|jgi:hypothetical protein|uniref:SAV_915 family protein n=1 Tax=unclassified Aeromicrobium TaxID=2633570 RepID=UPI000AB95257|nr:MULTISPECIES: SAV_915 family protein [unclassified Aeromicrobium]MCX6405979.1 hypothetical protein [Propionibacteriales bacterium]
MTQPFVQAGTGRPALPPVVYVPTSAADDPSLREVQMHTLEDGRTALFVYSAIDRLHDLYRPDVPWLLCDVATLQRVHDETPYDLLFLDLDPGLRDGEEARR